MDTQKLNIKTHIENLSTLSKKLSLYTYDTMWSTWSFKMVDKFFLMTPLVVKVHVPP